MDYTQNQEIWQWLDLHWDEFCDYWASKMKEASNVEQIAYDPERISGLLANFKWQGVSKVVKVTPDSLLQALSQLNDALRQRCIEGAEAAEIAAGYANSQGDYAKSQGDRIDALIQEITTLKALVKSQGDTAEAQGAATENLRQQVDSWYTPFKATAEAWYSEVTGAWSAWFDATKSAWSAWFDATKEAWNTWYGDTVTTWNAWFSTTKDAWDTWFAAKKLEIAAWLQNREDVITAFFGNISDTWDDMTFMFSDSVWNSNTVYLRNKATRDDQGNWWVSLKSTVDEPNINHPIPGFDENGDPITSEWWKLWIDWQHPLNRVLTAIAGADTSAANADEKARLAQEAADHANSVSVVDHENRITVLENSLQNLTDEDIADIKSAILALQNLIGADVDGNVNKFNEIVSFLTGIADTDTLAGLLAQIAEEIAAKQDAGDYATNERVDTLEEKVDSLVSPKMVGTHLTFPSRTTARMDGSHLILAE